MKRFISLLLTLTLLLGILSQSVLAAYSDVSEESWYAAAVDYVDSHGLFYGTAKTEFSPDMVMDRSMFVTVLYRLSCETATEFPDHGFSDVPSDTWYSTAVAWGAANGIVSGTSDTTFSPTDPVTREQICALVLRYCGYIGFSLPENTEAVTFDDHTAISEFALSAVETCQKAGLIVGYENMVRPQDSATRAEVASIFSRLGSMLENAGFAAGPGKTESPEDTEDTLENKDPNDSWQLLLVNRWNPVPEGYVDTLELRSIGNGMQVDARIYDDLMAMLAAAQADGVYAYVNSAFRTNAYQSMLYNNKIYQYQSMGYSYANAVAAAQMWVAVPGTSEHEIGLAVDISMYASNSTSVYAWLAKNAWQYGFIYRYQADKVSITGINPEAWHYRYVGKAHAKAIYESGLCLEEYVAQY